MRDKARQSRGSRARFNARPPREEGAIIKDWGGRIPVALIYPNSYYLGMSNLGIHAIYNLLNGYHDIVCERVFWQREGRDKNPPIVSVESSRPLTDFAVLAFSASYELDYFNVIAILKSSGIPIYAADRDERYPLVIVGGPCVTANPVPLSPFFDCLCIGEAEPILPRMLPVLSEGIGGRRDELLKTLSTLPGIYVPALPEETPVPRQWAKNLDDFATTSVIFTPDTELGDLFLIEVERGCNWGCRFCLVNSTFAPMRFRSVDRLMEQARQGLRYRKRIGLVGPAVTDHPRIEEMLASLRRAGAELSISSLRIRPLSPVVLRELASGKTRTIALAPEAGSERLRRVIKKEFSEDDILKAIDEVAKQDIRLLKLYFMLGLPSETDEDVKAIIGLTLAAKEIIDRRRSKTRIVLTVAPFVPKAGTPFQWLPMASLETLNRRLSLLRSSLPAKGIKLKAESPAWSQVQGILSRGDAKVSGILADVEEVSLSGWRKAVSKHHLDVDYYIKQRWDTARKLPWSIIETGTSIERLQGELKKAKL
jgi:radical SAM superfamily enzyme YgiQ (UPF0313 family)